MENRAVVHLNLARRGESCDIDIPLDINASELLAGLNQAFNLGIDTEDSAQCYVKSENPIRLIHGRKTLAEYGVMTGSVINVTD